MTKIIIAFIFSIMIAFIFSVALIGCAGNGTSGVNTDRLGIKIATMKYIGDDFGRAERVLSTLSNVEGELDADKIVLAEGVISYIESKIDLSDRPIEEVLLIQELVYIISLQIEERIDGEVIDADSQVMIRQVIGWVREAAEAKKAILTI